MASGNETVPAVTSPREVYNALNNGALVVDARVVDSFEAWMQEPERVVFTEWLPPAKLRANDPEWYPPSTPDLPGLVVVLCGGDRTGLEARLDGVAAEALAVAEALAGADEDDEAVRWAGAAAEYIGREWALRESVTKLVVAAAAELLETYPFMAALSPVAAVMPAFPSHVAPGLFLSSQYVASRVEILEACGIKFVLNVARECKPVAALAAVGITVLHLPLDDEVGQDLDAGGALDAACEFLARASPDQPALVHCAQGISRSSSVLIAFLVRSKMESGYAKALARVRAARPIARPNPGFARQLVELLGE
ncbi:dual specificity protein phosphatase [Thecamonas trahens ATCC 50062]|uniref:protein-tyrosine-phosphatase n=1 Tax=Thecamonas trahens ATCC 50062 TaxID=461836 RepID=A0A0L0DVF3_THETB|nr:dual specificity protein phosphatase [Thecamonas trahens ATCC 50062]KNC55518.1 dual specificity protein phosphatase [Thecamonas trahens ATCC 50062]|eukprot:XP_013761296.1 dual specificity protein phosphatase [Thecamonas trahens ATCC 50062]